VWIQTLAVTVEAGYTGWLTNLVHVTTREGASGIYTATTAVREPPMCICRLFCARRKLFPCVLYSASGIFAIDRPLQMRTLPARAFRVGDKIQVYTGLPRPVKIVFWVWLSRYNTWQALGVK
jgi:hypothetical protein